MDEEWVEQGEGLFFGDQIYASFSYCRGEIDELVAAASDDEVLKADVETWSAGLGADHRLDPPAVDLDAAELESLGRIEVNVADAAGITMTASEMFGAARVMRPGYRFESRIPVSGESALLHTERPGTERMTARIFGGKIIRVWLWPDELGALRFGEEVDAYKAALARSVEIVATAAAAENDRLATHATTTIEARRQEILREREFLGNMTVPVIRAEDAPEEFGPPPVVEVESPARRIGSATAEPAVTELEPRLDEFYAHILSLIRTVDRSLERTPGSFTDAKEETLRDLTLVTLNTHYRGATYAEAFNGAGKTDILIRVYDHNAFIGECKWWTGPKGLREALGQLFGYLTARDTRAALVFYVSNKDLTATVKTASTELEARPEFIEWQESHDDFELCFRMHAPEDEARVVMVAAMFVHLPKG